MFLGYLDFIQDNSALELYLEDLFVDTLHL